MARIYTRTGDRGETGLGAAGRVRKDALRIAAIGGLDELNAAIGIARAGMLEGELDKLLGSVQHQLFDLGALLARPAGQAAPSDAFWPRRIAWLEREIDRLDADLSPLGAFILPGGTPTAASLHFARTVCRRAERGLVALDAAEPVPPEVLGYVNRLSDLLFVAARAANARQGRGDVLWQPGGGSE